MDIQRQLELWNKIDTLKGQGCIEVTAKAMRQYLGGLNSETGRQLHRLGVCRIAGNKYLLEVAQNEAGYNSAGDRRDISSGSTIHHFDIITVCRYILDYDRGSPIDIGSWPTGFLWN